MNPKISRYKNFINFIGFTDKQIEDIKSVLSVEYTIYIKSYGKFIKKPAIKNFLFFAFNKIPYTYFGYYDYIIKHCSYKIDYEDITGDSSVSFDLEKLDVDKLGYFDLYYYQQMAIKRCLHQRFGNVALPVGSGKTLIMFKLFELISKQSIIVVSTIQLAQQHYVKMLDVGFSKDETTIITGSSNTLFKYNIIVSNTLNILIQQKPELLSDVKVVFYDECHHRASNSWISIDTFFSDKVDYSIGFTGSLYRYYNAIEKPTIEDWGMVGLTGIHPIFEMSYKSLISEGFISVPYIYMNNITSSNGKSKSKTWSSIKKTQISNNLERNRVIAEWIKFFYDSGKSVMILSDRVEHIKNIIKETGNDIKDDLFFLTGNSIGYTYRYGRLKGSFIDYNDIKDRVSSGDIKVLFASSVLDEGSDISNIRAIILAYAGKSRIKVLQRIGRGIRKSEGKDKIFIIDFFDSFNYLLKQHSNIRKTIYKDSGFNQVENIDKFKELVLSS